MKGGKAVLLTTRHRKRMTTFSQPEVQNEKLEDIRYLQPEENCWG
jgi:hypothetical protein